MSSSEPSRADGFIAVTPAQRDTLLYELSFTLGEADDLKGLLFHRGLTDLNWRCKLDGAMWLLDDLGSEADEPRDEYYVTLPTERFEAFLRQTREGTLNCLRENVYSDAENIDRELDVVGVCDQLLAPPAG
jgi:hypothetical protein